MSNIFENNVDEFNFFECESIDDALEQAKTLNPIYNYHIIAKSKVYLIYHFDYHVCNFCYLERHNSDIIVM